MKLTSLCRAKTWWKRLSACRNSLALACVVISSAFAGSAAGAENPNCPALLQHAFPSLLDGKPKSLCEYSGKVLLVVNTASECGYTPQYEGLEALYRRYQKRGLVIVGFPSNDFGSQEPGTNKQVAEFCQMNYGVTFPMFEKSVVAGSRANPLYLALAQRSGAAPKWNFHKYLLDRSGARVVAFDSEVAPTNGRLVREIERLLAEPAPAK